MSEQPITKVRLATVWLDGCSGCHMSFLDMDERLLALAGSIDLVYSPLVDNKIFPESVDVTLVEGSVSTDEEIIKIRKIRKHTKFLISLGDCAVTGNVPAMRNPFGPEACYDRAFIENTAIQKQRPTYRLPTLLDRVRPVHEVVQVDLFVPGCPPPAGAIHFVLSELLAGRMPNPAAVTRFGL
ncbi:MAG: NADP oxidoreductase [Tepidisphaeraceae bacterium]|jgi:NAD-reducing hydrogenase small subunit